MVDTICSSSILISSAFLHINMLPSTCASNSTNCHYRNPQFHIATHVQGHSPPLSKESTSHHLSQDENWWQSQLVFNLPPEVLEMFTEPSLRFVNQVDQQPDSSFSMNIISVAGQDTLDTDHISYATTSSLNVRTPSQLTTTSQLSIPSGSAHEIRYYTSEDQLTPDTAESSLSRSVSQTISDTPTHAPTPESTEFIYWAPSSSSQQLRVSPPSLSSRRAERFKPYNPHAPRYNCKGCNLSFSHSSDRKRHWDTSCPGNTGRVFFSCEDCQLKFTRKDAMKKHMRLVRLAIASFQDF